MKTNDYQKYLSILSGVMLLLAIPPMWPYGYFQILRWVVAGTAGFNVYIAYQLNKKFWLWAMVVIAILFNPIAPIHLTKEIWAVFDLLTAVILFVSVAKIRPSTSTRKNEK